MVTNRNYSSISRSAQWLALTRATTTIPFAREVAILLFGEAIVREAEAAVASMGEQRPGDFENRY